LYLLSDYVIFSGKDGATKNPRDEKLLLTIKKKENKYYESLVPFSLILKEFPRVKGIELSHDLQNLTDQKYLWPVENPVTKMNYWHSLTADGRRECERIASENSEKKRTRSIQI